MMSLIASSMVTYLIEHKSFYIPSLTLVPTSLRWASICCVGGFWESHQICYNAIMNFLQIIWWGWTSHLGVFYLCLKILIYYIRMWDSSCQILSCWFKYCVLIMEPNSETLWKSLQKEMNQDSVRIATQKVTPCRQIKRCWATIETVGNMGPNDICFFHSSSHIL